MGDLSLLYGMMIWKLIIINIDKSTILTHKVCRLLPRSHQAVADSDKNCAHMGVKSLTRLTESIDTYHSFVLYYADLVSCYFYQKKTTLKYITKYLYIQTLCKGKLISPTTWFVNKQIFYELSSLGTLLCSTVYCIDFIYMDRT